MNGGSWRRPFTPDSVHNNANNEERKASNMPGAHLFMELGTEWPLQAVGEGPTLWPGLYLTAPIREGFREDRAKCGCPSSGRTTFFLGLLIHSPECMRVQPRDQIGETPA